MTKDTCQHSIKNFQPQKDEAENVSLENTRKALEKKGYKITLCATRQEAADYITQKIEGKTVGFGDSQTLWKMDLFQRLSQQNTVYDPNQSTSNEEFVDLAKKSLTTEVYLTSVNAMSETGEMVNIDGTGNRIAGSLFGHNKVYFVVGSNKIEKTLEKAIVRARNVASPRNAKKYNLRTPCVAKGDKCYDCASPDRICNAMTIYFQKMRNTKEAEIIIIDEELGY